MLPNSTDATRRRYQRRTEPGFSEIVDVLNVIHCGIDETEVIRVALKDVELCGKQLKEVSE